MRVIVKQFQGNVGPTVVYDGTAKVINTPSPYGYRDQNVPITGVIIGKDTIIIETQVTPDNTVAAIKGQHQHPVKNLYLWKEFTPDNTKQQPDS